MSRNSSLADFGAFRARFRDILWTFAALSLTCASAAAHGANHYVVTGSFESLAGAVVHEQELKEQFSDTSLSTIEVKSRIRHRVSLGPFTSRDDAEQHRRSAIGHGFSPSRVYAAATPEEVPATPRRIATPGPEATDNGQAAQRRISRQSHVLINQFAYEAPVLADEVSQILAPFVGTEIPVGQLLALKDAINKLYASHGFVNSGALIPDQKIHDGVLRLDFISGAINDIQLESTLSDRYVTSRLEIGQPFNLEHLQQSLKLLEQDPLITRIDARVAPGLSPGEATLALKVETTPRVQLDISAANDRSPSIGSSNGQLAVSTHNLTGWGETSRVSTSVTRGLNAFDAGISLPVTSRGLSVALQYALSDSSVIEEPFDDIDVDSETESLGLMVTMPLYRTLAANLELQLTLEARRNQTSLLGQAFSFSEGAIDGESQVAPVRLAIAYTEQNLNDSMAARLSISRGTSLFDATPSSGRAGGRFTSYLGQFQYSRLVAERLHLTARALMQHASDPLLSIEKYALGGMATVRGYRENQIVRDSAWLASLEAHYRPDWPVWVDLIAFLDWGSGENHRDAVSSERTDISSIGVGAVLKGWRGFSAELYIAHGFDDFAATEHDLQDDGIHFRLGYHHDL
jgi:hemolysin activation/secretion protein